MRNYYTETNGYLETIQKALIAIRGFDLRLSHGVGTREEQINRLKNEIERADAILVGAGAGNVLNDTSSTLRKNITSKTFTPAVFIRFPMRRRCGRGGQGTSITTAISTRRNPSIPSF